MILKKASTLLLIVSLIFMGSCDNRVSSDKIAKVEKNNTVKLKPVELVYPQLDTENSRWFLFASASRPFGMVSLSPDTQLKGTWGSGYRYEIDTIKGFSHIHGWQLSGLSVMPITFKNKLEAATYTDYYSKFSHDEEKVEVGYHSVKLKRYDIKAELTSTTRTGFHRYTFPEGTENAILFNLNKRLGPCKTTHGNLIKSGASQLSGEFIIEPTKRKPKANSAFFYIDLNTPIKTLAQDKTTGNYSVSFEATGKPVLMKIGLSYTSIENAKQNLAAELSGWNFNQTVVDSKNEWNNLLSRIAIEGGSKSEQRRFYTDLWHALLGRKIINDVNGSYPNNMGKNPEIGQLPLNSDGVPLFNHYNSDAFWGSQWTINTLWGLVYPEIKKEFVHSLLQYEKDGGLIPRGPSGGNYTYVMTGAPSTPFIVSAIQKGIIKDDLDIIYQKLKRNHTAGGLMEKSGYEHTTNKGGGFSYYETNGYVPYPIPEGKFGGHQDGASLTMEYAYQDYVLAQLAKKLGKEKDYTYFFKRSKNYKNVYDASLGWMRPKNIEGIWKADFDPYLYENGFNESNGAQATWFVPHDLEGLAKLMGGNEKAIEKLNNQFKIAQQQNFTAGSSHDREMHPDNSRIPINYGNQPSMQSAYIFTKLGRPDLTQYWSRQVVQAVFNGLSTSTGYNGDEDQGLMGSLAVLMKIGIFQMDGGTTENPEYLIGSPSFDKITIQLNQDFYSGKTFEINAKNNSTTSYYIDKALLNDKTLDTFTLSHNTITTGGVLKLDMTTKKNVN